jgi:hypothetical protein
MMHRVFLLSALALVFIAPGVGAQLALPRVEGVEWAPVRARCQRLLEALRGVEGALPPDVAQKLATLLKEEVKDAQAADRAVGRLQELLDPLCLVGVNINPQSRVKAARGAAASGLVRGRLRVVLVKIDNDAGITPALEVGGDELRLPGRPGRGGEGRWLEAVVVRKAPLGKNLSGSRLEYVPLRLTAYEAGKREATLKFDAGQGTQDLGFRAEVPVLFRITEPRR